MTLSDRGDAPEVKRRLEELPPLVPALRTLRADLDTLGLPGSADLALVTTHDDPAGLTAYQEHPAHQAFLAWLRPRLAGRAAVDYES